MGIYIICFGQSENNLKICMSNKVIGVTQKRNFERDSKAYMLIKRNNRWQVVSRTNIIEITSDNPFEKPNKYTVYKVDDIEKCHPFDITELLKKEFGSLYGLVLRSPNLITNKSFINEIEKRFIDL